jgi:hypothetical protein
MRRYWRWPSSKRARDGRAHVSTRANSDVGWLHLQLREPIEAARACERTLAIDASSLEAQGCLERAHVQRGSVDMALEARRRPFHNRVGSFQPKGRTPKTPCARSGAGDCSNSSRLLRLDGSAHTRWPAFARRWAIPTKRSKTSRRRTTIVGMMVFLRRDPVMDTVRQPRASRRSSVAWRSTSNRTEAFSTGCRVLLTNF